MPTSRIPGRSLLNARLTWRSLSSNWEATAAVANVTDEVYYTSLSGALTFANSKAIAPPREWSIKVTRRF